MPIEIEKERLSAKMSMPGWVWQEHNARYNFASKFVLGKTVIDCACGSGVGTNFFIESGAKQIDAFDLSETAVTEAIRRYGHANVSFRVGSALKLPLDNDSSDVYISLETIEHLKEDEFFLAEVKRVLKPGGIFICSTPNRIVTNPGKSIDCQPCNKFHVREYSQAEFTSLLKKHFSKVELFGQNPNNKLEIKLLGLVGNLLPFNLSTRILQAH